LSPAQQVAAKAMSAITKFDFEAAIANPIRGIATQAPLLGSLIGFQESVEAGLNASLEGDSYTATISAGGAVFHAFGAVSAGLVSGTFRGPKESAGTASIVDDAAPGGGGGFAATGGGGRTLYHYTTDAGRAGIAQSGEIWASQGANNARHGAGQYFTDIAPEAIRGRTLATTPAGQMSLGQLSSRLFRVPWNTRKLSSFLEIGVEGLNVQKVAPNIYLVPNSGSLSVTGRVVRSGATLP
jgi:hypothetical protein